MKFKCPICGKEFESFRNGGWLYRDDKGKRVCSYSCSEISRKVKQSRSKRSEIERKIDDERDI